MQTFIGHSHPTIFKFIDAIIKEQSLQEFKIAQISASQDPEPRKKKYALYDTRLRKIVENYDRKNLSDYITSIAHNVVF